MPPKPPSPFFEVVLHDIGRQPALTWICSQYELGKYRANALASHLFDWLPEFALSPKEYSKGIELGDLMGMARRSAAVVYDIHAAKDAKKRGEFGELLLHAVMREVFKTQPAITKMYYKTASNDNVKGFDAVHAVFNGGKCELWLGEVKFYESISSAIGAVVDELKIHTEAKYLKNEFIFITNHLDPEWEHYANIKARLRTKAPLEQLFDSIAVPVVLTYESKRVKAASVCATFHASIQDEIEKHYDSFVSKLSPSKLKVKIHLILIPLEDKQALQKDLHRRLKACRTL